MAKTKTEVDWRIVVAGLAAITILECVALLNGMNGTLLKIVLVAIGTFIGITIPTPNIIKR